MGKRIIYLSIILAVLGNPVNAGFIAFWNGTSGTIPSGWSCISCNSEEDTWWGRFPMCSSAGYGTTGGANPFTPTHSHTFWLINTTTSATTVSITLDAANGVNIAYPHIMNTMTTPTNKANSSLPLYVGFLAIKYTSGLPSIIPSGVLIWFNGTAIPDGFSRPSGYDYRFPEASDSYGTTGGAMNHTHNGINFLIASPASLGVGQAGTKASTATSSHTHPFNARNLSEADNTPNYYTMVLIQSTGNSPIPNGTVGMFDASVANANWTQVTDCNNRLLMANNSYGNVGGAANHSHNNESGTVAAGAALTRNIGDTVAAISGHTHVVSVGVNNASNFPPYITVLMYRFQSNVTEGAPPASISFTVWTLGNAGTNFTNSIATLPGNASEAYFFNTTEQYLSMLNPCAGADRTNCQNGPQMPAYRIRNTGNVNISIFLNISQALGNSLKLCANSTAPTGCGTTTIATCDLSGSEGNLNASSNLNILGNLGQESICFDGNITLYMNISTTLNPGNTVISALTINSTI